MQFSPSTTPLGGTSQLSFTIVNPAANPDPLNGVGFSDTLPAGLTVADSSQSVCGGTLTSTAATRLISLSGATIAAGGQCQFSVAVTGSAAGANNDSAGPVSSANGGAGNTASANLTVHAGAGDWPGAYGSGGYVLAGWNGSSDLVALPGGVGETLQQGGRYSWASPSTDPRALQSPDGTSRTMATYYDSSQVRVQLSFPAAYAGNLHLYALDPDDLGRRESITVDDGSGPRTVHISTDFSQGAWVTFPISVAANGTVSITVTRDGPYNAVLSGIMLGDSGPTA
jgi:uncharacterized repeat protein (TIGR01451 family)